MLPETSTIPELAKTGYRSDYMPQLDTLRTFAVFFVLIEHWLPENFWLKIIPYGMIGVTAFFVLSGFLITQILIRSKISIEVHNTGIFNSLKQFYARRTLRIFPIYYLTVFIAFILNFESIRQKIFWYVFYLSNIYFYKIQGWDGALSHLWTLAVEEQFYVFWPIVIIFISRKYLLRSIVLLILFAMVFRGILFQFSDHSENSFNFISILTPSCLDCFGLGAVLAYLRCYKDKFLNFSGKAYTIFLLLNIFIITSLL
ncbi:MAG: acyltransferase, partial [Ignavibacteria bacterium]